MSELTPSNPAEIKAGFSAERELSDSMVREAERTLSDLQADGLTRTFKPYNYWQGPSFVETAAVDLSEDTVKTLEALGYPDAKQAYMVKTGSYGKGSWRGFGGAYVRGYQTDYEVRILTGKEFGKSDKHPNPDAFLGRGFATISPECPVRLNTRLNTEAQNNDSAEIATGSASQQALEQVISQIHSTQSTEAEPKFVASNL